MTVTQIPSNEYWERRSALRMDHYQRDELNTINRVQRAYNRAQRELQSAIDALLQRYAHRYGLTNEDARRILNEEISDKQRGQLEQMYKRLADDSPARRMVAARLNVDAMRYRISNLEALQVAVDMTCAQLADIETRHVTERLIETAKDAYDRVEYDLQSGVGIGWDTTGISERQIKLLLREEWSGASYSERIWGNARAMAEQLHTCIMQGMLGGKGYDAIADEIALAFETGRYAAARLMSTETSYIANAAELERYQDEDIKRYLYISVLDRKTSELCQEHDGNVYNVSDAKIGVNFPPLHPWCRSTTGPAISLEWIRSVDRTARNMRTGQLERIPGDMDYREWKQWQEAGCPDIKEWRLKGRSKE